MQQTMMKQKIKSLHEEQQWKEITKVFLSTLEVYKRRSGGDSLKVRKKEEVKTQTDENDAIPATIIEEYINDFWKESNSDEINILWIAWNELMLKEDINDSGDGNQDQQMQDPYIMLYQFLETNQLSSNSDDKTRKDKDPKDLASDLLSSSSNNRIKKENNPFEEQIQAIQKIFAPKTPIDEKNINNKNDNPFEEQIKGLQKLFSFDEKHSNNKSKMDGDKKEFDNTNPFEDQIKAIKKIFEPKLEKDKSLTTVEKTSNDANESNPFEEQFKAIQQIFVPESNKKNFKANDRTNSNRHNLLQEQIQAKNNEIKSNNKSDENESKNQNPFEEQIQALQKIFEPKPEDSKNTNDTNPFEEQIQFLQKIFANNSNNDKTKGNDSSSPKGVNEQQTLEKQLQMDSDNMTSKSKSDQDKLKNPNPFEEQFLAIQKIFLPKPNDNNSEAKNHSKTKNEKKNPNPLEQHIMAIQNIFAPKAQNKNSKPIINNDALDETNKKNTLEHHLEAIEKILESNDTLQHLLPLDNEEFKTNVKKLLSKESKEKPNVDDTTKMLIDAAQWFDKRIVNKAMVPLMHNGIDSTGHFVKTRIVNPMTDSSGKRINQNDIVDWNDINVKSFQPQTKEMEQHNTTCNDITPSQINPKQLKKQKSQAEITATNISRTIKKSSETVKDLAETTTDNMKQATTNTIRHLTTQWRENEIGKKIIPNDEHREVYVNAGKIGLAGLGATATVAESIMNGTKAGKNISRFTGRII